jgi:hypothetical protein
MHKYLSLVRHQKLRDCLSLARGPYASETSQPLGCAFWKGIQTVIYETVLLYESNILMPVMFFLFFIASIYHRTSLYETDEGVGGSRSPTDWGRSWILCSPWVTVLWLHLPGFTGTTVVSVPLVLYSCECCFCDRSIQKPGIRSPALLNFVPWSLIFAGVRCGICTWNLRILGCLIDFWKNLCTPVLWLILHGSSCFSEPSCFRNDEGVLNSVVLSL